jgi:hypothetical protein
MIMRMYSFLFVCALVCLSVMGTRVAGQTAQPATATNSATAQQSSDAGITARYVFGEVTAMDAAAKQLSLRTDAGNIVGVTLSDATAFKRLAPGEKTLDKATPIALSDIGTGDRVMARGRTAADRKSIPATEVIVMTRADLTQKQEREQAEWRRGVVGTVSAINPQTGEITVQTRPRPLNPEPKPIIVEAGKAAVIRRYAPDSVQCGRDGLRRVALARLSTECD